MTIHAYNESYLDDAMQNLGDMLDYALVDCGYAPDEFFLGLSAVALPPKLKMATRNTLPECLVWSLRERSFFSPQAVIPPKKESSKTSQGVNTGQGGYSPIISGTAV